MGKSYGRILVAFAVIALTVTGSLGATGSSTGAVQAASAGAPSPLGGVWAGKAWLRTGFFPAVTVEVPARGLIAVDGSGYLLVRDTVLRYSLLLSGAPLVGTAPDTAILPAGNHRPLYMYAVKFIPQQSLELKWCASYMPEPDGCIPGWDRMLLHYNRSYESGSSLARIAGHYIDTRGQYKGVLTIAGDGYVFMQDPATGCVVNGRVSVINRAYSVYAIKLGYANCRSPAWSGGTFTGLVSYDGGTRQLFALMLGTAANLAAGNMLKFVRR